MRASEPRAAEKVEAADLPRTQSSPVEPAASVAVGASDVSPFQPDVIEESTLSTKFPNDGLTDEKLAKYENSELGRINRATDEGLIKGLGPLEDYTRYKDGDEEETPMDTKRQPLLPVELDFGSWGGLTRPIYTQVGGQLVTRHIEAEDDEFLRRKDRVFEGNYQTVLRGKDLVIPPRYDQLFRFGGVVAPGTDQHLTIFGGRHWDRMLTLLAKQVGVDPYKNTMVRHVMGRAMHFDKLNVDGTVTLNDDLLRYAGLVENGKVAWVGMIYHAEIHNNEDGKFKDDHFLSAEDIGRIFNLATH